MWCSIKGRTHLDLLVVVVEVSSPSISSPRSLSRLLRPWCQSADAHPCPKKKKRKKHLSPVMPPIKGQSVVVIGGSSGIGAAAAKLACIEGLKVTIASSNRTRVDEAVQKIQDAVPDAQIAGLTVDISGDGMNMESNLEKLFTDVAAANQGHIDHIILTAGLANVRPVSEYTAEYFHETAPLYVIDRAIDCALYVELSLLPPLPPI
jgi:hypothetical protein